MVAGMTNSHWKQEMQTENEANKISRLKEIKSLAMATRTSLKAYVRSAEVGKMFWFKRLLIAQTVHALFDVFEEIDRLSNDYRPLSWSTMEELDQVERLVYSVSVEVARLHRKLSRSHPVAYRPVLPQPREVG